MKFTAPRRLHWLLLISALVVYLDRFTKAWVETRIPIGGAIPLIPRFLRISHWTNEGAAFSLFADSASPHTVRYTLIGISVLAALIVFGFMVRLGNRFTATTVALALILAGALGNLHDRIVYGSVVDFNVADSAIVTGACLLLLDTLLTKNEPSAESPNA